MELISQKSGICTRPVYMDHILHQYGDMIVHSLIIIAIIKLHL